VKGYKVKFKEIQQRGKAYFVVDYNGNEDYIPISQSYYDGFDLYVSEWILQQKTLKYSNKNPYFIKDDNVKSFIEIVEITPKKVNFDPNKKTNKDLLK